jgi:hypothetical protein
MTAQRIKRFAHDKGQLVPVTLIVRLLRLSQVIVQGDNWCRAKPTRAQVKLLEKQSETIAKLLAHSGN